MSQLALPTTTAMQGEGGSAPDRLHPASPSHPPRKSRVMHPLYREGQKSHLFTTLDSA